MKWQDQAIFKWVTLFPKNFIISAIKHSFKNFDSGRDRDSGQVCTVIF